MSILCNSPPFRVLCLILVHGHSPFLNVKPTNLTQKYHASGFDSPVQRIAAHLTLDRHSTETEDFVQLRTKYSFVNVADHILPNNYKTASYFVLANK